MELNGSDWGDLPSDLLISIAQQLDLGDFVRLQSICLCWARILRRRKSSSSKMDMFRPFPWVQIPDDSKESSKFCDFLSLTENRRYRVFFPPEITNQRFVGSSTDGWLVYMDALFTPHLLNPLTCQHLSLPSLCTLHDKCGTSYGDMLSYGDHYEWFGRNFDPETFASDHCHLYLRKFILTSSPLQGGIAVAVIWLSARETVLSFATVGDEAWSPVLRSDPSSGFFVDGIYHEGDGKFYALTNLGVVYILERAGNHRSWNVVSMLAGCMDDVQIESKRRCIIISNGDLLQVTGNVKYRRYYDVDIINIFKFDPHCQARHRQQRNQKTDDPLLCPYASCWMPVTDLGNRSLFVGANCCFALQWQDTFPAMENRVFFNDGLMPFPLCQTTCIGKTGIFELKSKSIVYRYHGHPSAMFWQPALWFMPSPSLWD